MLNVPAAPVSAALVQRWPQQCWRSAVVVRVGGTVAQDTE